MCVLITAETTAMVSIFNKYDIDFEKRSNNSIFSKVKLINDIDNVCQINQNNIANMPLKCKKPFIKRSYISKRINVCSFLFDDVYEIKLQFNSLFNVYK